MPIHDFELECPHCGATHVYRLPAGADTPFNDYCEECGDPFTVDPADETASV